MCWGFFAMIGHLFQAAFWFLIIAGGIFVVRRLPPRRPRRRDPINRSVTLLNERYARGEIGRDEYLERKAYLE